MAGENTSARRGARTMVARPRLSSALDNALDYAVTLVCAPAGYGKTAAVNSWLSRRRIEALRFDCSALAGGNNRALSQAETLPCIFVFENAHALSDGADAQKRLRRFLAAMPDGCHALVISRNVPKLGLSRLKVDGDLLEISKADLAFTELETVELFGRAGMALSVDEARDIARKTQGWPAALRLVRAEAAARGTLDEATWDAAETALYDYVSEEVLDEMGADDAGFFRGVSHLGQFCASQAAFSLEMDGGRVLEGIDRLVAAGLVQPKGFTSIGEVRYCCHPLLSDVISRRSRVSGAFGRAAVLSRASSWAEEQGEFDVAFQYAKATCDWDRAASVVMRHWRDLFECDNMALLRQWMGAFPERYVEAHPGLCIIESLPLALAGNRERAFSRLRIAKEGLKERDDSLAALYYALRGLAASVLGDREMAVEASNRALEALDPGESSLRAMAQQVIGGCLADDDPLRAIEAFEQAQLELKRLGLISPLASALSNLANLCSLVGRDADALAWSGQAKALYDEAEHENRPMLVVAYLASAWALYNEDDIAAARKDLRLVLDHMGELDAQDCKLRALLLAALISWFDGDSDSENCYAAQAAACASSTPLRSALPLSWIARRTKADSGFEQALENASAGQSPFARVARLSLRCATGRIDDALVQECEALATTHEKLPSVVVHARIAQAVAAETLGDAEGAARSLRQAFACAEGGHMVRPFLDDADMIAPIWARIARESRDSFAADVYKTVSLRMAPKAAASASATLTERELDVVRLAAEGLSVQQIADRLFVSRETVKKHLSNVYSKLGVHGKMQAVALLKRLGAL